MAGIVLDPVLRFGPGSAVAVRSLQDAHDRDLLRLVASGDEEAFLRLFRGYAPVAKALAVRIVRQASLAEEVVQEAFLALWRDPERYREDLGSVRGWLLAMVHHRAVDMVRREEAHRRRSEAVEAQPVVVDDVGDEVVESAGAVRSGGAVRDALGAIPPEQRTVLERMYFEGKTQARIAEELGLPLGTVKSRTLLGMRRLRTLLLETGDDEA